jgi:hypothetical protein
MYKFHGTYLSETVTIISSNLLKIHQGQLYHLKRSPMSNPWGNYTTSRQLPVFSNFPGISGELRTEKSFCLALRKQTLPGLTLEGEEIALWLLTSLCTSAKREVEVVL